MFEFDYKKAFGRNKGFIDEAGQEKIKNSSVAIAGAGGDGGLLAERISRFGFGKIILADPEVFEINNINRQFAANKKSLEKNKAEVVAEEIKLINPQIKIKVFEKGIDLDNVEEFVSLADVVIDEIEYSCPELTAMLARECRKQKKYLFMGANIGWGASIFCFAPEGMTFEEYFLYNERDKTIDASKYLKDIPEYLDKVLLERVLKNEIPVPSISSSVALVAALVSSRVTQFIYRGVTPKVVPEVEFIETYI